MKPAAVVAAALVGMLAASYATKRAADVAASDEAGTGDTALDYVNPWGAIARQVEQAQTEEAMRENLNLPAFLSAIAWAEGTDRAADPYRVCYSYRHTVQDMRDHPAVTGEWKGEPLDSLGPRYVGLVSTAAGRYQIIKRTWLAAKRALALPDFSPDSQDKAAAWLIKGRGALPDVERGDIRAAIDKCAAEWASLPGSTSGQPQRKLAQLLDVYGNQGGNLA